MKKIIIAALIMLTLGATQAEYTLQIPLEQAQGGFLPNGSIIYFEEPNSRNCNYDTDYIWNENTTKGQLTSFYWDGTFYAVFVDSTVEPSIITYKNTTTGEIVHNGLIYDGVIEFDGFRYTKDDFYTSARGTSKYGICREPI